MGDLLSAADRAEIRAGIQDVTDTFCKTPCIISLRIGNADRLNRQTGTEFNEVTINGLLEFGHLQSDQVFMNEDGSVIKADIKVTLNVDDMEAAELLDGENQPIINMTTDKITCHGVEYRMIYCGLDGAIGTEADKDKNLICVIIADREPTQT